MDDAAQLKNELGNFQGGDPPRYQQMFPRLHYTEGFRHFMENAGNGAHWFFQILATQPEVLNGVRAEGFGCVKLLVQEDHTATLVVDDGDDEKVFYTRHLDFTDCPALLQDGKPAPWMFFIEPYDERGTLLVMLPQER